MDDLSASSPGSPQPSTPAAGWYPDPEDAEQLRYWNGESWTEHRSPAVVGLKPIGEWFSETFSGFANAWKPLGSLLAMLIVPGAIAIPLAWIWAFWSVEFVGLGDLFDIFQNPNQVDPEMDLTDASVAGFSVSRIIVASIISFAAFLAIWVYGLAARHQLYWRHAGQQPATTTSLRSGAAALPRMLLWWIVVFVAVLVVFGVLSVLTVLIGPVFLIVVIPMAVALTVFAWVRVLAVFGTALAVTRGNPIRTAYAMTAESFFPLLGRVLLWFVLAWVAGLIAQTVVTPLANLVFGADRLDGVNTDAFSLADLGGGVGLVVLLVVGWLLYSAVQTVIDTVTMSSETSLYRQLGGPADALSSSSASADPVT